MLLSGLPGTGGNHWFQGNQHAGLPTNPGFGPFAWVAGSHVGDERCFMQLTPHAVAAKAPDQVQTKLTFDQVLHRDRPIK